MACASISTRCASDDGGAAAPGRGPIGLVRDRDRAPSRCCATSRSRSRLATPSVWSANPVPARPSWRAPILGLVESPLKLDSGSVLFEGRDLLGLEEEAVRRLRGRDIALTTPEPRKHLNPLMTIGAQIANVVLAHADMPKRQAMERAVELLRHVGIPDPASRIASYPHELSGGMCAARHHRHGTRPSNQAPGRRRAHGRPRRHHLAADPRSDQRPGAAAPHRSAAGVARPRRGRALLPARRRHVRWPHRRGGRRGSLL